MINVSGSGKGLVRPFDTEEYASVTVKTENGIIIEASYECSDNNYLVESCRTVCNVIIDKPAEDIYQMNNNAVYYNVETSLPRDMLYCASMAVLASKRAVTEIFKENGIPVPDSGCTCTQND